MAKRNPYWGKQKGKLGETVLSVVKGQQVQRAYNGNPTNPKTVNQTGQRIKFASAVKFQKAAVKKTFEFAYLDKKPLESYYNAFMRHNINNAFPMAKELYDLPAVIPVGKFIMSTGTLKEIIHHGENTDTLLYDYGAPTVNVPTTCQQVANLYKLGYNLQDGDILTFIAINTGLFLPGTYPADSPRFGIFQIEVGDASDERTLASVTTGLGITATTNGLAFGKMDYQSTMNAQMAGIIVSRKSAQGLLVSNCTLGLNQRAHTYIHNWETSKGTRHYVLSTWGANENAVLEGSLLPQ